MYHYKLYSAFMSVKKDEVLIRLTLNKFGAHTRNTKDIISKFEYTEQDRVSKNQNNLIGYFNQHKISQWDIVLICFSIGH